MLFTPTQNQSQAIENMEKFCQIKSNRTNFDSKDEFDNYFELLQKRWNKRSKLLDSISSWKTSYKEIEKKKKEKIDKFYSNYDSLKSYWIKYINRYIPSIKRLELALQKKNSNIELIYKVIDDIKSMIDEEKMINSLITNLKSRGKNINYITSKLYNKKFCKELLEKAIIDIKWEETLLNIHSLENKILSYKNKWKSKTQIKMLLIEREQDKQIVNESINNIFWEFWENEILKEKISILQRKKVEKRKIISRLISKWFKYSDIIEYLN